MIQLLQKQHFQVILTEDGKKRKLPTSELDNSKKVLLNECGDICGVYCTFNLSLFKKISDILKAKWHDKKDMWTISINDLPKLISYLDLNNIFWEFQLNWKFGKCLEIADEIDTDIQDRQSIKRIKRLNQYYETDSE